MSEEEAEYMIVQALKDPKSEGRDDFIEKTERKAKVDTKDLVAALNEHLELRHDGNRLYGREESTNQKKKKAKNLFRFSAGILYASNGLTLTSFSLSIEKYINS